MTNRIECFTTIISKIQRNIKKVKNIDMHEYNLKGAQVACLYYLYIHGSLTSKELCEKCEEDKATISRALEYLEFNDYVVCSSKYSKRYNSPFTLTEKGIFVSKKIEEKINVILDEVGLFLIKEERNKFYQNLIKINEVLEKINNQ